MGCCHDKKEEICCNSAKKSGDCGWISSQTSRILGAGIFAAIVMYLFEGFWHGQYLMPIYETTKEIWRPYPEMAALSNWSMGMTLALALALSYVFSMNYENRGIGEGVRFGIAMGVLIGLVQAMAYVYLPISLHLAILWLFGWIIEGVLIGMALALAHLSFQKNK